MCLVWGQEEALIYNFCDFCRLYNSLKDLLGSLLVSIRSAWCLGECFAQKAFFEASRRPRSRRNLLPLRLPLRQASQRQERMPATANARVVCLILIVQNHARISWTKDVESNTMVSCCFMNEDVEVEGVPKALRKGEMCFRCHEIPWQHSASPGHVSPGDKGLQVIATNLGDKRVEAMLHPTSSGGPQAPNQTTSVCLFVASSSTNFYFRQGKVPPSRGGVVFFFFFCS